MSISPVNLRLFRKIGSQSYLLAILVLSCIALGIIFRFVNLNQIYWHDEAYTSLRLSGFDVHYLNQTLFQAQVIPVAEIMRYQGPHPENSLFDTIRVLALDDAQHPPLYYILAWAWVKRWGDSIPVIRSLSALISLLGFPLMFWWCYELFYIKKRKLSYRADSGPDCFFIAGLAVALLALSPFHMLYAQEAREYALWTVLILAMNGMVLRAIKHSAWGYWLGYGLLVTLGFYTYPLTGLVALSHGFYVWIMNRVKFQAWAIAAGISFGLFAPWLYLIVSTWHTTGATWTAIPISQHDFWRAWGLNLVRCFVKTPEQLDWSHGFTVLIVILVAFLMGLSLIALCRHAPPSAWLFLILMLATTILPLLLPDIFWGGQRSLSSRYLIPGILCFQVILAYCLATLISQIKGTQQLMGWAGLGLVLSLGIGSGIAMSFSQTSWIKVVNYRFPELYNYLNAHPHPLIVGMSGNINTGTMLALAHGITPQAQFLLVDGWDANVPVKIPTLPSHTGPIFLLNPTPELKQGLEHQRHKSATLLLRDSFLQLWQLQPALTPPEITDHEVS